MPGTKTSVWLGEADHARWKASGLSLTEIVRAGLDAIEAPQPAAGDDRAVLREELAATETRILSGVREELERIASR